MARWQLTEPCYLNVPGTFWEQVVTDRNTQRPIRKQFPVPRHLDPRIESDWNYNIDGGPIRQGDMDGKIIVGYAGKCEARDYIFEGPPNPGMLPLDDEAREISGKFNWAPTERVSDGFNADDVSNSAKILSALTAQLAEAMTTSSAAAVPHGMDKFMESMSAMMQQQTMLFAAMMERMQLGEFQRQAVAAGAEAPDIEEPLPDAEHPTADELVAATVAAQEREAQSQRKATEHAQRAGGLRRA